MPVVPTINRAGESQHVSERVISVLNGSNTAKASGITKSFRVDEDIIRKIDRDARNNNISLNAKINNIHSWIIVFVIRDTKLQ
jgi:hypothetical protein